MDRPTASAALYPKMRSAPPFHEVIRPSSVLLTIASSDESTIAARSARASDNGVRSTGVSRSIGLMANPSRFMQSTA